MSAYVVDPRTIDYLVAWATRHRRDHCSPQTRRVWDSLDEIPENLRHAASGGDSYGYRLDVGKIERSALGRVLMAENIRSVRARYPDAAPDDLPGPHDQTRVWNYTFRPIREELDPAKVIKACDCWTYQSCETPDWRTTVAYQIVDAIREDAISAVTEDAPWGISETVA